MTTDHSRRTTMRHPFLVLVAIAGWLALATNPLLAQNRDDATAASPDDLTSLSLPWRTALYHDPSLGAPLDRLIVMYREPGRTDELVALYRNHLATYPTDAGAAAVLLRVLQATNPAEAQRWAQQAIQQFPQDAYLQYLAYISLKAGGAPGALDHLAKAIELETKPTRQKPWIELFVPEAVAQGKRELAEAQLRRLLDLSKDKADDLLAASAVMSKAGFHEIALEALKGAAATSPSAETMVEIEMAAASEEVALNNAEAAGARLDTLLGKLTPDYWRRAEILRRRLALVTTEDQRTALIAAAKARLQSQAQSETATIDLAQVLAGLDLPREALDVLLKAPPRLAQSPALEKMVLELFDRLRDEGGREVYIAGRLKDTPQRQDLAIMRVKSLYLLSRRAEAEAALNILITAAPDDTARVNLLQDIARFLRRSSQPADAEVLFTRLLDIAPDRFELRRELAEIYLAQGRKQDVAGLFSQAVPANLPPEVFTEILRFLIKVELWSEAKNALAARIAAVKNQLDDQLMLISVLGRLGQKDEGEALIETSRALADTGPRYQQWLDAAWKFHQIFESQPAFLAAERARLEKGGDTSEAMQVDRWDAFLDLAGREPGNRDTLVGVVEGKLKGELPLEQKIKLRQRWLALIESDPTAAATFLEQLTLLMKEDPAHINDYRARRILFAERQQQQDGSVYSTLREIDPSQMTQAPLLEGLYRIYSNAGDPSLGSRALQAAERLTQLDPSSRVNWQRWISALALTGDEVRFRTAVQRLLAGVDRMPLSQETQQDLQKRWRDSLTRSVSVVLQRPPGPRWADALPLVDQISGSAGDEDAWLAAAWLRVTILRELNRPAALAEATKEFERVLQRNPEKGVLFPDGLTISADNARRLLTLKMPGTEPGKGENDEGNPSIAGSVGPAMPWNVKWVFDLPDDINVTAIVPVDDGRVIIADRTGKLTCLDGKSGKVRWEQPGVLPATSDINPSSYYQNPGPNGYRPAPQPYARTIPPLFDGDGRLVLSRPDGIIAVSTADGQLLWKAPVPKATEGVTVDTELATGPALIVRDGRVWTYQPECMTASMLQGKTGKLMWTTTLPGEAKNSFPWSSGASMDGGHLFVYGPGAAVIDATTGRVEWLCDGARARRYPIELTDPALADDKTGPTAPPTGKATLKPGASALSAILPPMTGRRRMGGSASLGGSPVYGGGYSGSGLPARTLYIDHLASQRQANLARGMADWSLVAPAVKWAEAGEDGSASRLAVVHGNRLLLLSSNEWYDLSLALPIRGTRGWCSGTYIGMAGRRACFLQSNSLAVVDVTATEDSRNAGSMNISLEAISGGGSSWMQACVDGVLVYVTGPGGIACVNTATQEIVATSPWPAQLQAPAVDANGKVASGPSSQPIPILSGGVVVGYGTATSSGAISISSTRIRGGITPVAGGGGTTQINYQLRGLGVQSQQRQWGMATLMSRAIPGLLLVAAEPNKVVAITTGTSPAPDPLNPAEPKATRSSRPTDRKPATPKASTLPAPTSIVPVIVP